MILGDAAGTGWQPPDLRPVLHARFLLDSIHSAKAVGKVGQDSFAARGQSSPAADKPGTSCAGCGRRTRGTLRHDSAVYHPAAAALDSSDRVAPSSSVS